MQIWEQINSWLRDDWEGAPSTAASAVLREVELWRMQLVHGLLVVSAIVAPVVFLHGAYGAIQRGRVAPAIGFGLVYAVVLVMAFWRRVAYGVQVFGVLGVVYLMGLSGLLIYGWYGDTWLFFLVFSLLTALFLGAYPGFIALGSSMISVMVFGMLGATGVIPLPSLTESLFIGAAPMSLVSGTVILALLGTMLILSQRYLVVRFIDALVESRSGIAALQIQQQDLVTRARHMQQVNYALQHRTSLLEGAVDSAAEMMPLLDTSMLFSRGVEQFAKVFDLSHVGLYTPSDDGAELVLRASSSEAGRRLMLEKFRVFVAGTLPGRVWTDRKSMLVQAGDAHAGWRLAETRAAAVLPLCHGEQCFGVLDLQSVDAESLRSDDLDILEMTARLFAIALENAGRVSSDAGLLEAGSSHYRMAQRFAKAYSVQDIYSAALETVREQVPQRAFVLAFSEDGVSATLAAELRAGRISFPDTTRSLDEWFSEGILVPEGLNSSRPLLIGDVKDSSLSVIHGSARASLPELTAQGELRSLALVPIRAGEVLLGVLGVVFQSLHVFTIQEETLLSALMGYFAAAFARLRLMAIARKRVQMEQKLREFSDDLAHAHDVPLVVSRAAQALKAIMEADGVLVRLLPDVVTSEGKP